MVRSCKGGERAAVKQASLHVFSQYLNTPFFIDVDELPESVTLQLVQVEDKGSNDSFEVFSLLFQGPPEPMLPQRLYRFTHSELGPLDMFTVPIDPKQKGILYEVVFNRRMDTESESKQVKKGE